MPKISALTALGPTPAGNDRLVIVDTSAGETKGIPAWAAVGFKNVAALLADTTMSYSGTDAVAENDLVWVKDGNFVYKVRASGASDHHLTNANATPVKLDLVSQPADPKGVGAAGDGTTDDNSKVVSSMTVASGGSLKLSGTYRITAQVAPAADTHISGHGRGSGLKTTTTDHHLVNIVTDGVTVENLKLEGTNGTTVLNNSAIVVSTSGTNTKILNTELTGMSGYALYVTGGAEYGIFGFSHVHDLAGSYTNTSDVGLYSDAHNFAVAYNRLDGGAGTQVGVLQQLNSTDHKITFNYIGAHTAYGAIDYDTTPRTTYNLFLGNTVEDIDGATLSGTSGAGFYAASTGGQIISANHFKNTNISTTDESLAPGSIGINGAFSPLLVNGNYINGANWYGTLVTATTGAIVHHADNVYFECDKTPIYVKASSHANLVGGSITALTTTPLTQRGIGVNPAGGGPFTGVSIIGHRIRGTGYRSIDCNVTNNLLISGNNISETAGYGIVAAGGAGLVVSGNVVDVTASTSSGIALYLSNQTYTTVSGNVFKSGHTTIISIDGTCTGTRIDKSNIIVGESNPMNFINNAGTGCIVEMWGTAAPTLLAHQVGDIVWNSAPSAGGTPGWICTTAGTPGTWKAMASVAA